MKINEKGMIRTKELSEAPIRTKKELPAPKGIGAQGICSESREATQFYLILSNKINFVEEGRVNFTNSSASG